MSRVEKKRARNSSRLETAARQGNTHPNHVTLKTERERERERERVVHSSGTEWQKGVGSAKCRARPRWMVEGR